ncbi:hypothetical protein AXG93_4712s1000 [Marchantia polymorpha subsp. ruderalis]|uniref:Uncharacterized protein n=1 Tax=Marchantia polymorpha subsp. ruderalis TaxID=1480154 RepID=A0A176W834_MARPO|nr:hypothetical protein AXG93_4712s1000 [Marchantia polymorpha subsp. ruderalis]
MCGCLSLDWMLDFEFLTNWGLNRIGDRRIRREGFGKGQVAVSGRSVDPREEEKKSVLSGLVGFGSNSIRQSIDMINNYNHYSGSNSGSGKNLGSYRGGQSLRRSLTSECERPKEKIAHWDSRDAEADESRSGSSSNNNKSHSKHGGGRGSDGRGELETPIPPDKEYKDDDGYLLHMRFHMEARMREENSELHIHDVERGEYEEDGIEVHSKLLRGVFLAMD